MVKHYKKGDFAVGRVGVVMFLKDTEDGVHYEHVSNYENGAGITCGGAGMGGGKDHFKPLSTAEHFILSRAYAAMKARDEAKAAVAIHEQTFRVHEAALKALKSAERAVAEAEMAGEE